MIRKKADKNILRFRSRFDGIEDLAEAMIQITDLSIVSGLHDSSQRWVDRVRPNGVPHEGNFLIQIILFDSAENKLWHSVGIIHSIERDWRSQWRMRSDK